MAEKKLINQKLRLEIWRVVRRKQKDVVKYGSFESVGLCKHLYREAKKRLPLFQHIRDKNLSPSQMSTTLFPELLGSRPTTADAHGYWWSQTSRGQKARLNVCNKIIAKLEYKK